MRDRPWFRWPSRDRDLLWPDPRRRPPGAQGGVADKGEKAGKAEGSGSEAPDEGEPKKTEEPIKLDWIDALAFGIAMFQILIPYFLAMAGAILAVYGLFWLWFRH